MKNLKRKSFVLAVLISILSTSCSHCDDEDNNRDQQQKSVSQVDSLRVHP